MAHFTSTLLPQLGAHPISTSTIHFPRSSRLLETCTLHLYFSLPPLLFVDTHELSQRNSSYSFKYWGTRDLERPVHALPEDPSELLVNVKIPEAFDGNIDDDANTIRVEVPMHLRYGKPKGTDNQEMPYQPVNVDWPQVFFQCTSTQSHSSSKLPSLPSHILAPLASSQPGTLISIPPHASFSDAPQNTLLLPLGNPRDLAVVEPLTALTIIVCFFWLLRISWKVALRLNTSSIRPKTA